MSITIARRAAAGLASAAVVTSGLALAAPAQAAEPSSTGKLDWKISQRFVDHLNSRTFSDGATFDAETGSFSFPEVSSTFDTARGISTTSFDGSVRGAFAFGGSEFYSVTIEDPTVTVDATGEGTVTAVVSSANASTGPSSPAASTDPKRVTVTTFDVKAGTWTSSLTATPRWAGVIPTGSALESLAIPANQPVDGKAFAPSFLANLTPGVRAHFYASGAGSDATKAPAPIAADIDRPSRSASVSLLPTSGTYGKAAVARASVTFTGGSPADGRVIFGGAVNREVTLRNGVAEVTLPSGLAPGTAKISATFVGDVFTPPVVAAGTVSVSRASVTVIRNKITKKPTTRRSGKTSLTLRSAAPGPIAGKVAVSFKKKGQKTKVKTVTIKNGKAKVTIPKLAKGTWRISVKYAGSNTFAATASKAVGSLKVTKK